jgi:hypothetical protein
MVIMRTFAGVALLATSLVLANDYAKEDQFKTIEELCHENGFATESYTVYTEDNYVLTMYRIPGTNLEMQSGDWV